MPSDPKNQLSKKFNMPKSFDIQEVNTAISSDEESNLIDGGEIIEWSRLPTKGLFQKTPNTTRFLLIGILFVLIIFSIVSFLITKNEALLIITPSLMLPLYRVFDYYFKK